MIYTTGFIIINEYFDTRKARAMGLASLGTAAGAFVFPPVVQLLFDTYGFQGTFFIMAALVGNAFISAALYRPLKQYKSVSSCFLRITCNRRESAEDGVLPDVTGCQGNYVHSNQYEHSNHNDCNNQLDNVTEKDTFVELKNSTAARLNDEDKITKEIKDVSENVSENKNSTPIYKPNGILKGEMSLTRENVTEKLPWSLKIKIKLYNLCKNTGLYLLRDIGFSGYCFLSISVNFMLTTAMGFIPALAVDRGLNQLDAAILLSVAGAANMAAVLPIGWIMDLPAIRMRRPYVYTVLTAVIAVTMLGMRKCLSFNVFNLIICYFLQIIPKATNQCNLCCLPHLKVHF